MYTDKELGLPMLNMITPVGVEKPRGKKKGKVFVDDSVRTLVRLSGHESLGYAAEANDCLLVGEHDDHTGYCHCRQGRANRK